LLSLGCDVPPTCSTLEQKQSVLEIMMDVYLWNDEPAQSAKYANIQLAGYATANDLLDYLRYEPDTFDKNFSYIDTVENDNAFSSGGEFSMYGFLFAAPNNGTMVVQLIVPGSPAEQAGLSRGDEIKTIDGRTIAEIEANEGIGEALGNFAPGTTRSFYVESPRRVTGVTLTITTDFVALPPIAPVSANPGTDWVFDRSEKRIGYLPFFLFIETAEDALQPIFNAFRIAGVTDLVVDLRYNSGGLLWVANYLGSLLVGPSGVGNVQFELWYNSRYSSHDEAVIYSAVDNSLTLDSIVFITTEQTVSAGELIINSLFVEEPSIDIAVVGSRSFGKPVGQGAFDFCRDRLRLRAVAFETVNASGEGGYYEGLPVDCPAPDDLDEDLGSDQEASLATALAYIENDGVCPAGMTLQALARETPERAPSAAPVRPPWLRSRGLY
jgi:C-terminal processing protease CtpA/Prc